MDLKKIIILFFFVATILNAQEFDPEEFLYFTQGFYMLRIHEKDGEVIHYELEQSERYHLTHFYILDGRYFSQGCFINMKDGEIYYSDAEPFEYFPIDVDESNLQDKIFTDINGGTTIFVQNKNTIFVCTRCGNKKYFLRKTNLKYLKFE